MGQISGMEMSSSPKISPREARLFFPRANFKVKFPLPETQGPFRNFVPVRVNQMMKGKEISQWLRNKDFVFLPVHSLLGWLKILHLRLLNSCSLLSFPIFPKTKSFIFRYINRNTEPNAFWHATRYNIHFGLSCGDKAKLDKNISDSKLSFLYFKTLPS